METYRLHWRWCCFLMQLASLALSSSSSSCTSFHSEPICPAEADKPGLLARLSGVESAATCQLACGLGYSGVGCSAVHFSAAERTCWLATARQWQDRWRPAGGPAEWGCRSQLTMPGPPRQSLDGPVMWYNFRHSLLNLANPGAYPAQLVNAVRNATGVHLLGAGGSYVAIAVPPTVGFQSIVGPGSSFTYYMRSERDLKPRTYYLRASDASPNNGIVYVFEQAGTFLVGNAQANAKRFDTASIADSGTRAIVSLGVTFDSATYKVYYNGSQHPAEMSSTSMNPGNASDLRLGYRHNDDAAALSGRIICFGVWTRALGLGELQSLEPEC